MDLEKPLAFKRAFTGYSTISVLENIQLTQENYQKELTSLKEKIRLEREMNQKLKEEVELNYSVPQAIPTEQNVNPIVKDLTEQLVMNTKSIVDLQHGLEEQESIYRQELELKKKQKDLAKKRIQEALQYLKTLPSTQTESKKKQRE